MLPAAALIAAAIGCTNDPFDPDSLPNQPPVARIFIASTPGDTLNPTSYFERTFHWSGSDVDGFVTEYYVSVEKQAGTAASWATTTRTDTTMTFSTDDEGLAQALVRVACRDDRGAVSDTVSQYIPLRNFPPVINFTSDYDTVFTSFASANFRFFALDLDGNVTMDDSVTFYLDTADTMLAPMVFGEEGADPSLLPVRKALDDLNEGLFEVEFHGTIPPGERTLHVLIGDEADATTRFDWEWESKPAVGPVLLVDDYAGSFDEQTYYALMDSLLGVDGWSMYQLEGGLPDRKWVLLETFAQFECLFWYTGTSASDGIAAVTEELIDYFEPVDPEQTPGKMLLVSKSIIGSGGNIPPALVQTVLGINRTPSPPPFYIPVGKVALGQQAHLIDLPASTHVGGSVGLVPMAGAETIYQMEYHRYYPRPPFEPVVGVRNPSRTLSTDASTITLALQLENLEFDAVIDAVRVLFEDELGVVLP